jgi:lipid II:glycine glycyltransferase (peptidoglycan interpeptide bridge formation enzyme)
VTAVQAHAPAVTISGLSLGDGYHAEVRRLDNQSWSDILDLFADASVYQAWSYGVVRWGAAGIEHVVVRKGGEVVAAAQVAVKTIPLLRAGVAYVPWGPLWRRRGSAPEVEHFRLVSRALRLEYAKRRGLLLRIAPNEIDGATPGLASVLAGEQFSPQAGARPYRTILLDLGPPLDELRKNLSAGWRQQLTKSEKLGFQVTEGDSAELFDAFLELYREMLARKRFDPGVNCEEFALVQQDLLRHQKMRIVLCTLDGVPASGAICAGIGDTGIYLFTASGRQAGNTTGSHLLQWRVLEWLKAEHRTCYDLGGIDPVANESVYRFKAGLAGKTGRDVCHVGVFEASRNPVSTYSVRLLEAVRKRRSRR